MLKPILYPFVGLLTILKGAFAGLFIGLGALFYGVGWFAAHLPLIIGYILRALFFVPNAIRIEHVKCGPTKATCPGECRHQGLQLVYGLYIVAALVFLAVATVAYVVDNEIILPSWIMYTIFGIIGTNIFSSFYELGRWKMNKSDEKQETSSKTQKTSNKAEEASIKEQEGSELPPLPEDTETEDSAGGQEPEKTSLDTSVEFDRLWDKAGGNGESQTLTETEADELYKETIAALKAEKLTASDAERICARVHRTAVETIKAESGPLN